MNIKSILTAIVAFSVLSFAAIPKIEITTQGNINENSVGQACAGGMAMMIYDYNYARVTNFKLTDPNDSRNNVTSNKLDSIRVRGNSTSSAAKKPYRIKFQDKVSLFGKEAARSWVLLANFYDGTFALNAMAFEMGKRMGLEFTLTSQLVDLYINGQYKGIYQLTEQVQSNPGRVDIREKHNGWFVEFDYHDASYNKDRDKDKIECLTWYNTGSARYNLGTFIKAPALDDTSFTKNPKDSTQLRFVKTDIKALLDKMSENGFPNNGYRDLIDLESFAKYVLVQLVLDNFDFNSKTQTGFLPGSNYAYKIDDCTKIKAGPLWDFDLAAGVTNNMGGGIFGGGGGGFPAHYQTYQDPIIPKHAFYEKLWADPVFKAKYKKAWDKYKNDFTAMGDLVSSISSSISGSIAGNGNNIWANNSMNGSATLTQQQHNTEVSNLKTWWNNRLNWVGQQLQNIDTSADIAESTPNCKTSSSSSRVASSSSLASSSSSLASSSSSLASSSSSLVSSSSSSTTSGGNTNCAYQASWCGNTVPTNNSTAKPATGQCVFVRDYTALTISSGGGTVLINGTTCTGNNANCTASKPAASDGGYYIYVQTGTLSGSQPYTVTAGAPVCAGQPTPIILPPTVTVSNLPGAKVEVYNLQGKLVYSSYSGNSQILQIPVQTKGIYIVKTTLGSEKKIQRLVVK